MEQKDIQTVNNMEQIRKVLADLGSIMKIHNGSGQFSQYYEINYPFSIQIATNCAGEENGYHLSSFAPDFQNNISIDLRFLEENMYLPHFANYMKCIYVIEGNLYLNIDGKKILYTSGSACLINRHILEIESFDSDYCLAFINMSSDFVKRYVSYGHGFLFLKEETNTSIVLKYLTCQQDYEEKAYVDCYPLLHSDVLNNAFRDILTQMIGFLTAPSLGDTFRLLAAFSDLIQILSDPKHYQSTIVHSSSNMNAIIFARITQLMAEHNGRISRNELEIILNYSGSHLSRIVKACTGMSLYDYSLTFTMSRAAEMLCDSDMSIASIMQNLRFTNQTHFYHLFRRHFGCSPKEYRERNLLQ